MSRYKFDRSQKIVKGQNLSCLQMSESGYNTHNEFVLGAGAKAKSVTNNLPLLSVLAVSGVCPELLQGTRRKSSLKQQRNCKHDDSQGILSLSMGNEPVSYKTDQLEVSPNKDMSRHFEVVYRSGCSGTVTKPPCGAHFSRVGYF